MGRAGTRVSTKLHCHLFAKPGLLIIWCPKSRRASQIFFRRVKVNYESGYQENRLCEEVAGESLSLVLKIYSHIFSNIFYE